MPYYCRKSESLQINSITRVTRSSSHPGDFAGPSADERRIEKHVDGFCRAPSAADRRNTGESSQPRLDGTPYLIRKYFAAAFSRDSKFFSGCDSVIRLPATILGSSSRAAQSRFCFPLRRLLASTLREGTISLTN